jgi:hypothetical protein
MGILQDIRRGAVHQITAHQQLRRIRGSGQALLALDHIFRWSSFNRKDSHKAWSFVCARLADSDHLKTSVMRKRCAERKSAKIA